MPWMEMERRAARAAEKRPVKIRIASHSPFHLSVVFLSSSSDLSRYMVDKASDLSTDLDSSDGSPCESSGRRSSG